MFKFSRTVSIFTILAVNFLLIFSCDMDYSNSQTNNGKNNDLDVFELELYKIEKCVASKIGESYIEGDILYHTFKIGRINNVPIYKEVTRFHQGVIDTTYTWEETQNFENIYSAMQSNCQKYAISTSIKTDLEGSIGSNINFSFGGVSAGIEAKIKAGIETSNGTEVSSTNSMSETVSAKVSTTKKRIEEYKIGKTEPVGYYTYVIFDNLDVYVIMSCDYKKKEDVHFTYLYLPKNNLKECIYYSKDDNVFDIEKNEKLSVSLEDFADFDFYDESDAKEILLSSINVGNILQDSPNNFEIRHDGQYGLENNRKHLLNLSEYSKYMSDDYLFSFNVKISYEAKWIDRWWIWETDEYEEGNKQIFLYKSEPKYLADSSNMVDSTSIREHFGLLCEETWAEDKGVKNFSWNVNGSDCTENMCIKYDSYGEGEDTWYLKSIMVNLTINPK